MKYYNINLFVIFHLIFVLGSGVGVRITELRVPAVVEPSEPLTLSCEYELGGEELHSVKWYKDEQEFFRYMPRQQPHEMAFPVAGVHADPARPASCSAAQCSVHLTRLTPADSSGQYQCEVSSEAPRFHVAFQAAPLTVAVRGTFPVVHGLQALYSPADLVQANCSVRDADPAPILTWLLNGLPFETGPAQHTTARDARGLVSASRGLRLLAEPRWFPAPLRQLLVRCVVTQLGVPGPPRVSPVLTARLRDPAAAAATATRQQLEWLSGEGSFAKNRQEVIIAMVLCMLILR